MLLIYFSLLFYKRQGNDDDEDNDVISWLFLTNCYFHHVFLRVATNLSARGAGSVTRVQEPQQVLYTHCGL